MPTVYLSPVGGAAAQFFRDNGVPLDGGKIYTYAAGTTTPKATYTTNAANAFHTNPIILDSGRVPSGGEIWLTQGGYKFVIKTSADVTIGTYDNIFGQGTLPYIIENFSGDGSTVSFALANAPFSENTTIVAIDGVYQNKNTYSISSTNLLFSEAPPNETTIEIMYT